MTTVVVFAVQDSSGTVAQLTLDAAPASPIAAGDTGHFAGLTTDDTTVSTPVNLPFTVLRVNDQKNFTITTSQTNLADWPGTGTVTWNTGVNAAATSAVIQRNGANAYIDVDFLKQYHASRGNTVAIPTKGVAQGAIVKATDYLDQKYRFKGLKLLQSIGSQGLGYNVVVMEPWLSPFAFGQFPTYAPALTSQTTQWPRQGVVDFNGDTIMGIPKEIKWAAAELAGRVLAGGDLQPDYDPSLAKSGGVVQSITEDVGPIRTTTTFDTARGLGFFASFPQVDRMLSRAGLLVASGGRTILR